MSLDQSAPQPGQSLRGQLARRVRAWMADAMLPAASVDAEAVFDVLANERRRQIIRVLDDLDTAVDVGEFADILAAIEADVPVDQVESDHRKQWYVALYQTHIPPMADAGLVDVRDERCGPQVVAPTRDLAAVRRMMAAVEEQANGEGGGSS